MSKAHTEKHHALAQQASASVTGLDKYLSEDVVFKMKLAYIAQWLANQDLDHLSVAARTAVAAIDWLHLIREPAHAG
ncbi:MAG: hypothetical protein O9327_02475 [Polaromonas sp.]|nr:hypothetical protein [Polaromonas sp.]